jgi:hypothetical protein
MPPRRTDQRKESVPVPPPATVETRPGTTPVHRSGRPRPAAQSGESFDLANITGSEDEDEDQRPAQPPIGTQTTIPENDSDINNPDIVATHNPKQAGDIHYFFEKLPEIYQCKICK